MKVHTTALIASLLLFQPSLCLAKDPITIPAATFKQMKKGKKLERVWAAPGFDGTKGVRLGALTDETEDFAGVVLEYFPLSLRNIIKSDSPYILHLAIIDARLKSSNVGSSANIAVEGRVLDQSGAIVLSAFTAYANETIGGNAEDNVRIAVNTIVFAMTKDLFPAALPTNEKSPAVIVPPPTTPAPASAIQPAPAPVAPAPAVSAPAAVLVPAPAIAAPAETETAAKPAVPRSTRPPAAVSAPAPSAPPAAASPTPSVALPVVSQPSQAPMIPASTLALMKRSPALSLLWINPAYEKARGFSIGEVRYEVQTRNDGIGLVLPEALAGIATKDAPCTLEIRIVELSLHSQNSGKSTVQLGVEGRLVAVDGTLMAAFKTRENVTGVGDLVDDCRLASRRVVQAISKELR